MALDGAHIGSRAVTSAMPMNAYDILQETFVAAWLALRRCDAR